MRKDRMSPCGSWLSNQWKLLAFLLTFSPCLDAERGMDVAEAHKKVEGVDSKEERYYREFPFGTETKYAKMSDNAATGRWWEGSFGGPEYGNKKYESKAYRWFQSIPRHEALAFALYAHDHQVLKITAQCFPLKPGEPKELTLEMKKNGEWVVVQTQAV